MISPRAQTTARLVALLLIALFAIACGGDDDDTAGATVTPEPAVTPTATPEPEPTSAPSPSPEPTATAEPTTAPEPTPVPTVAPGLVMFPGDILVAGAEGISVVRPDTEEVVGLLTNEPSTRAVVAGSRDVVFVPGDDRIAGYGESIALLGSGGDRRVIVGPVDDDRFRLYGSGWWWFPDVTPFGGTEVVHYARETGVEESSVGILSTVSIATGQVNEVAEIARFESGVSHVSLGALRFLVSRTGEGLSWFEVLTSDGSVEEQIPGRLFPTEPAELPYVSHGVLGTGARRMVYVASDGLPLQGSSELVVVERPFDTDTAEVLRVPVGEPGWLVTAVDLSDRIAVVSRAVIATDASDDESQWRDLEPLLVDLETGAVWPVPVAGVASIVPLPSCSAVGVEPPPIDASVPDAVATTAADIVVYAGLCDYARLNELAGLAGFTQADIDQYRDMQPGDFWRQAEEQGSSLLQAMMEIFTFPVEVVELPDVGTVYRWTDTATCGDYDGIDLCQLLEITADGDWLSFYRPSP